MLSTPWRGSLKQPLCAFRSGFVVSAPTGAPVDGGAGELFLSVLMGAFAGLILGFIVSSIVRYIAFVAGRNVTGYSWTIYGALLGAALFAWLSISDRD